ncbi:hypothetical protein B7463_g6965, partial [Scytalidium lignicola]
MAGVILFVRTAKSSVEGPGQIYLLWPSTPPLRTLNARVTVNCQDAIREKVAGGERAVAEKGAREGAAPISLLVRLQTRSGNAPKTMVGTFGHVFKNDGLLGLYRGLSASLLRQLTYSTTRFGVYEELKRRFTTPDKSPSFLALVAIASTSGFLGGMAGNPADVLNVRMQHDAALPPEKRRNYKNAIDGLIRMTKEEGWKSLFRGVWPNSMRAILMTAGQLASYDGFKRLLIVNTPLEA